MRIKQKYTPPQPPPTARTDGSQSSNTPGDNTDVPWPSQVKWFTYTHRQEAKEDGFNLTSDTAPPIRLPLNGVNFCCHPLLAWIHLC